jgi:hypothetical protein
MKKKMIATLFAAFAPLVATDAGACDKKKGAHEAEAQAAPDERDTRVLAQGEPAEVTGTVTCSTCAEKSAKKEGPCSLTIKDASGKSYVLTANKTTHAIHTTAVHKGPVEVRGKTAEENGLVYLAPISFRVVTASEATSTAPPATAPAKDAPKKKSEGCCKH